MKNNEPLSAITHLVAMLFAIAGLVLLIVRGAVKGSAWHVVGFSIFGACMILLYLASTVYHFTWHHKGKRVMRKIDHAMIFVLIAGTYTPICLTLLRGGWGWSIFGVIWGLALAGILWKTCFKLKYGWISTLLYICMGWLIIIAAIPLVKVVPYQGLFWLVGGGLLYTIGTVFYGLDKIVPRNRWVGMHEIFHLFVMAGSFFHFWFMFIYVV